MNLSNALPLNIVVPVMPSIPVEQGTPTLDFAAMVKGVDVVQPHQPATSKVNNSGVEIPEVDIPVRSIRAMMKSSVAPVIEPDAEKGAEAVKTETPTVSLQDIQPVTALIASLQPNAICSNTVILRSEATLQSSGALTNPGLPRFARNDGGIQDKSCPERGGGSVADGGVSPLNKGTPLPIAGPLRPFEGTPPLLTRSKGKEDLETYNDIPASVLRSIPFLPSKKPSPAEPLFQKVELAPLASDLQTFLAVPASQITTAPSQTTPVSPTDLAALTDRHLNLARESAWLDTLASDIVAASNASDRLTFRLSPAHLGRLDIDLSQSSGGLSVHMTASTENATNIIAAAQPRLVEELRHQGVRVSGAEVATGGQQQQPPTPQTRQPVQIIEHAALDRDDETDISPDTRPSGRFA
jgi:flagellar hook-length control protein FliK